MKNNIKSFFSFKRLLPLALIFSMLTQLVIGVVPVSAFSFGDLFPKNVVTFDSNGGTSVVSSSVTPGSFVAKPVDPTRVGFSFDGWHYDACTSIWNLNPVCSYLRNHFGFHTVYDWDFAHYPVLTDLTLEAQWTPLAQYTVSAAVNITDGGTVSGAEVYYAGDDFNLAATPNIGYSFENWTGGCSGANSTYHVDNISANMSCKANFVANQYTITFDTAGGSAIAPITQDYGTSIAVLANPTWENGSHVFVSWDKVIPPTMPAENMTITAQWKEMYNLTFNKNDADDGKAPMISDYYDQNEVVVVPDNNPTDPYVKAGYKFVGWNTKADGSGDSYAPGSNIIMVGYTILYAQWERNQYTIDFVENGGSAVADITADFGTPVTAPANPTRTGYMFAGWDKPVPTTMPANNVTITAQWTTNSYTIYFDEAGGSTVSDITQAYGSAIAPSLAPIRAGYTFVGWLPSVPATMPAYNSTLTAQWANLLVTVTYIAGGGGTVKGANTQIINYGEDTTEVTATPSTGYVFDSWSDGIATATRADLGVTTSKTVTANFKASGEVKGATTDSNESEVAGNTDTKCDCWCNCNIFLGISWCWWILIIAIILAVTIWRVIVIIERRREEKQ